MSFQYFLFNLNCDLFKTSYLQINSYILTIFAYSYEYYIHSFVFVFADDHANLWFLCSFFLWFFITHCSHLSGGEENPISHWGRCRALGFLFDSCSSSNCCCCCCCYCCCYCCSYFVVFRTIWNHNYRCVYLNIDSHC